MTAATQAISAVDDGADDALRDGVLDRLHRAEPRDDVADMTLLEIVARQPQQVAHQIAGDLEAQEMAEHPQRPAAQGLDGRLDDDERAEAERNHGQAGRGRRCAIASSTTSCIWNGATKAAICKATDRISTWISAGHHPVIFDHSIDSFIGARAEIGSKVSARASSSTTPVKCLENSSRVKRAHADRRIVHGDALASDALQHDEVIEVPVQDRRQCGSCDSADSSTRSARVEKPS